MGDVSEDTAKPTEVTVSNRAAAEDGLAGEEAAVAGEEAMVAGDEVVVVAGEKAIVADEEAIVAMEEATVATVANEEAAVAGEEAAASVEEAVVADAQIGATAPATGEQATEKDETGADVEIAQEMASGEAAAPDLVEKSHILADSIFDAVCQGSDVEQITMAELSAWLEERNESPALIDALFAKLDVDGNGVIDRQEWRAGWLAGAVSAGGSGSQTALAPSMSIKEAAGKKAPAASHILADSIFDAVCQGSDVEQITMAELSAWLEERNESPALIDALFAKLDVDGNGVIDRQEWRAGWHAGTVGVGGD